MAYRMDLSHKCEVTHSAAHTLTTGVAMALAFDTEVDDTDAMHDTVTNNSRITIKSAGIYQCYGEGVWAVSSAGSFRRMYFRINGTTEFGNVNGAKVSGSTQQGLAISATRRLSSEDYVEMMGLHDRGSNLNITGARFRLTKVAN